MLARKPTKTAATATSPLSPAARVKRAAKDQVVEARVKSPAIEDDVIVSLTRRLDSQEAEIASLRATQDELLAAMLAELDSRIEDITARTDRIAARYG